MNLYFRNFRFSILGICMVWGWTSCSTREKVSDQQSVEVSANKPPAYIQKAWDARYDYEQDRRLLVPKYAGSRWGAVQQYKENGTLEYQDWWVRDLQREELAPSPSTQLTSFIDEDGNLTEINYDQAKEDAEGNSTATDSDASAQPLEEQEELPENSGAEEIAPLSPFSPFSP